MKHARHGRSKAASALGPLGVTRYLIPLYL
jgi:hypothetical protein